MKVVHLNTSDFGGAAIAAIQLHEALLEQGVESDLLTLNKTRNDVPRHHRVAPFDLGGSPTIDMLRYKARRAMEVLGVLEDRHNAPDNKALLDRPPGHEIFTVPYSYFQILDHPLVQAADVIHLHWVSYGMVDQRAFFLACTKRVVWTMHDMNPFTGGCHHADACDGFIDLCYNCPQLKDPGHAHTYWRYKDDGIQDSTDLQLQLVAPSQWLADRAMSSSIMRGIPCSVIPNGFDTDRMRYREAAIEQLDLPTDRRIVLFNALNTGDPRKGMQLLIPALEMLRDPKVMLVAIGGGANVSAPGVEVHHVGFIGSRDRLALYYSAADVFVLPSLAENLPNTITESLLCGTPVVAFGVGGIPEQVGPSDGILVEEMTSEALNAGIASALQMDWDAVRISERATQRYDRRTIAKAYQRIYSS